MRTQEGEQMATRIGACAYVENSSLTKEGVRNVSYPLTRGGKGIGVLSFSFGPYISLTA